MAPKPVEILAQERDFFDVRGSQEAAARSEKALPLLGAEQDAALHVGPNEHPGSPKRIVRRCTRGSAGPPASLDDRQEPPFALEDDERFGARDRAKSPHRAHPDGLLVHAREIAATRGERGQPRRGDASSQAVRNAPQLLLPADPAGDRPVLGLPHPDVPLGKDSLPPSKCRTCTSCTVELESSLSCTC